MNCKIFSGCEPQLCFHQNSNQINKFSNLGFSPSISFGTKLEVPSLHATVSSRGIRIRAMASTSTIEDIYMTTDCTQSLYDLLGVSRNGTISDIKKAYKQLARRYHPDVSPQDCIEEHTRKFIMAKEAYDTLSDPQRRAIYDRNLVNRSYPFAFSARNESQFDQKFDDIGEWTNRWQSQVQEINRKSMNNRGKNTCGARMRRQR
ncbi:hypothetical protein Leryth_003315 [Lithospermum erythrorhizon]|nr:hypothetical protein Leryth_003315 [Lithospermum erythrorhizon]